MGGGGDEVAQVHHVPADLRPRDIVVPGFYPRCQWAGSGGGERRLCPAWSAEVGNRSAAGLRPAAAAIRSIMPATPTVAAANKTPAVASAAVLAGPAAKASCATAAAASAAAAARSDTAPTIRTGGAAVHRGPPGYTGLWPGEC